MRLSIMLAASCFLIAPVMAEDSMTTSTTTIERDAVIAPSPAIVEPAPIVVTPAPQNNTIVVKKKSHHLLNLGVVKVF